MNTDGRTGGWGGAGPVGPASARAPASAPGPLPLAGLGRGSVPQVVEAILGGAVALGASDVHIEPFEREVRVRYRLDGVLHRAGALEPAQGPAIASRIKVLGGLDVAERRRPQDGRMRFAHEGRGVDLRVSVLPTTRGEKVVLRILDTGGVRPDLAALGLDEADMATLRAALAAPHGMVLVTGPTGSGKTTTLYAALLGLDREGLNVVTAEDPVEYDLAGVAQVQARPDLGFGFAEALRSFLRQDPDVILVGEVRDAETAQIAVRAALTGHLVLSTLHTNDAPSAPARLADMGVEPFLLAASLRLVVAQRLLRTLCPHCCREAGVGSPDWVAAAHWAGPALPPGAHVFVPEGCARCGGTGYRGRRAIFEVMRVDAAVAEAVAASATTVAVRERARAAGLRTLHEAAVARVAAGETSLAEAVRATAA